MASSIYQLLLGCVLDTAEAVPGFKMLISHSFSLLVAAGLPLLTGAQHVIDLSDTKWTVKNSQGNVTVPGNWPSQVHLDLYAAKVIGTDLDLPHAHSMQC